MTLPFYADLADKVVFVTGGATGLGASHVRAFAATGAKVAFVDIQDEPAAALVAEVRAGGKHATYLHCDLIDIDALRATMTQVREQIGPIFGLVNNAAVDQRHACDTFSVADFDWMMNANLRHAVFAAQFASVQMRTLGRGSIVNTSSVAWMRGVKSLQLYSAAKAAIIGLTHSLARELGPDRIRVNAIAPGNVPTPRQHALWSSPAQDQQMISLQCIPDTILPEDIANAAVFLCSDAARLITKQTIVINAGSL